MITKIVDSTILIIMITIIVVLNDSSLSNANNNDAEKHVDIKTDKNKHQNGILCSQNKPVASTLRMASYNMNIVTDKHHHDNDHDN